MLAFLVEVRQSSFISVILQRFVRVPKKKRLLKRMKYVWIISALVGVIEPLSLASFESGGLRRVSLVCGKQLVPRLLEEVIIRSANWCVLWRFLVNI